MELLPFSPLNSWTWLWEKLFLTLNADSKHILLSREPCPSPPCCCHLISAVTVSSKSHSIYQGSCFRMVGNMVRPVHSMIVGPLSHFSGCEVSTLVRSNTLWNTMMMDKALCKFINCGFGRSIMCKKCKSLTRISIYFSKGKALFFPRRKSSNVVSLSPGC